MTEQGKSQIQTLAAGFLGFAGVVGLGSLAILHHGGAAAPSAVSYAPVDAAAALSVPAPVVGRGPSGAATDGAMTSSPAPLLSSDVRDDAAAGAAGAAAAGPPAAAAVPGANSGAAPRLVAGSSLDTASSASSSASASVVPAGKKLAPAKKPFIAPHLDLSKNQSAIASSVHYGVSDRSQLMGRALGPVYNFSGGSAGGAQGAKVAAGSMDPSGAIQQVNAAQKQLDASSAPSADKAQIDQNLNQLRQTAGAESSSGQ